MLPVPICNNRTLQMCFLLSKMHILHFKMHVKIRHVNPALEDVHLAFRSKYTNYRNETNNAYLVFEHSGFIKITSNK